MSSAISKRCLEAFQTDDLYTIIGITAEEKDDLTDAKLKKAYHKKSKEWHPDRHADKHPEERVVATGKFQVIADAYRILGNPRMKAIYDTEGLLDDDNFVDTNDEVNNDQKETPEEDNSGDEAANEMAPMGSYQSEEENDEGIEYSTYEDSIDGYDSDVILPENEEFISDEEMDYSSNESDVDSPDYEIRPLLNGKTKLITFYFNDRSKCYHYYLNGDNRYYCSKCHSEKHTCCAVLLKNANGEQYIQMKNDHVCEPIDYYDDEIVTTTNFEIYQKQTGKELFIFADDDRSHFYQYYHVKQKKCYVCDQCTKNGKNTQAILNPKTGELEAEAFHQCEPQSYIPKIDASQYLIDKSNRGKPQLVVFADRFKKNCFKFHWHKKYGYYICNKKPCSIIAKLLKSSNGEKFVQMYKEHKCHPVPYE
uniref:J domain-containing protein n=1 Tax=Panagrolaimus davidi TaxID=227884 RepID=A0A914QTL2_9BILA